MINPFQDRADNAFSRLLGWQRLGGTSRPGYYLIAIRPRQVQTVKTNEIS